MKEIPLHNPYKNVPEDLRARLNVDIHQDDQMFLKSVSPRHGTIQTIVSLYVRTIILECQAAGIQHFSPDNIVKFSHLIKRYTHPSLIGEVAHANDSTGKASVHQPHPDVAHLATDPASKSGKGVGGKSKKKQVKKGTGVD